MMNVCLSGKISRVLVLCLMFLANESFAGTTLYSSESVAGGYGDGRSIYSLISQDGNYVIFHSEANDLVAGDTNGTGDVFIKNLATGTLEMVSVSSDGTPGDAGSAYMMLSGPPFALSAHGEYVAFISSANNLAPGSYDTNVDIFIRDRINGVTTKVTDTPTQANVQSGALSMSGDGRYLSFVSSASTLVAGDTNGKYDAFVYDRETGAIEIVSASAEGFLGNGNCTWTDISNDGRYVAFASAASNLVPDDTNGFADIFIKDRTDGSIERVSISTSALQANADCDRCSLSDDGRYIAFETRANNLVPNDTNAYEGCNRYYYYCGTDIFMRDRVTGETSRISLTESGSQMYSDWYNGSITPDGKFIAFNVLSDITSNDTDNTYDTYIKDLTNNHIELVSVYPDGSQSNGLAYSFGSPSNDGRYVAFWTPEALDIANDTNTVFDVYVRDRANDTDGDGYFYLENSVNDDCNDNDPDINPAGIETAIDGIDQDCNGYDLTIEVTKATYKSNKSILYVEASSSLGAAAALALDGYGPMLFSGNKWSISLNPAGGNPGMVTITGIEGSVSAAVIAQ